MTEKVPSQLDSPPLWNWIGTHPQPWNYFWIPSYAIEIGCQNQHNEDIFSNLSNQEKENTPNDEPNLTKMTGVHPGENILDNIDR